MCGCLPCTHYWDPAHNPGMCPDWEPNWQLPGSQANTQSTEPHQPGLLMVSLKCPVSSVQIKTAFSLRWSLFPIAIACY